MVKTKTAKKTSLLVRFLDLLIVLALLLLAFSAYFVSSRLHYAYDRDRYSLIASYAQNGEYHAMIHAWRTTTHYDVEPFTSDFEACFAVAAYAECAFLKSGADFCGDEAASQKLAARMKAAEAEAEGMDAMLDEIDALLEARTENRGK